MPQIPQTEVMSPGFALRTHLNGCWQTVVLMEEQSVFSEDYVV